MVPRSAAPDFPALLVVVASDGLLPAFPLEQKARDDLSAGTSPTSPATPAPPPSIWGGDATAYRDETDSEREQALLSRDALEQSVYVVHKIQLLFY